MYKKCITLLSICAFSVTQTTHAWSLKTAANYVINRIYGIQPEVAVVVFDINGVLLDFNGDLIPAGAQLLQKCAQAGHTIMLLSNTSFATIGLMYMRYYDELFCHIKPEHILISAKTKKIKPFPDAYQQVLDIVDQDPAYRWRPRVFFIDDTLANVTAANDNDMHGLHLDKGNYTAIEDALRELGVLA
jgi:ribonucleotide monophosphatase NagD (HAD superfamily)